MAITIILCVVSVLIPLLISLPMMEADCSAKSIAILFGTWATIVTLIIFGTYMKENKREKNASAVCEKCLRPF